MNILLINPKVTTGLMPKFPLGLGYIASVLRNGGHHVKVIDLNNPKESEETLKLRMSKDSFDLVGLTGFIIHFNVIRKLASLVRKNSKAKIVLGGGLATAVPELVLKETDVDIVVFGEGEVTVLELVDAIENGGNLGEVNGLWYKENGGILKTPPRELIRDLDMIHFPAWDLFDMDYYSSVRNFGLPRPIMSMITSRGCPHHCAFCFHGVFGHKYRARTVENILKEMILLKNDYGVRGFAFEDDTFTLDRKRLEELCNKLIEQRIDVSWTCSGRVNHVDEDLLRKMKKAGCTGISYGIESGNKEMLDRIDKKITVSQAKKAVELTWKVGLIPHGFMIIGIPGETPKTIFDSVKFCKDAGLLAEFSIATPIPGTPLYQEALNVGKIQSSKTLVEDWGHWLEDVVVNMTDIPDDELVRLKKKAERDVLNYFLRNHKKLIIKMFWTEMRVNGLLALLMRLYRAIRLFLRTNVGRGVSGIRGLQKNRY